MAHTAAPQMLALLAVAFGGGDLAAEPRHSVAGAMTMISMKVVNKWNRRLLRAVRGQRSGGQVDEDETADDRSIGSVDGDICILADHSVSTVERRTRESVLQSMPSPGMLSQQSAKHLDLLYALAYPKRGTSKSKDAPLVAASPSSSEVAGVGEEQQV